MDPVKSITGNPEALNPVTPTEEHPTIAQEPSTPNKKSNLIPAISVGVFVLFCLAVVGFLYNQNQQLKKMLASYQTQPSSTPVATTNPTANWNVYTNTKFNYSIKYPDTYTISTNSAEAVTVFLTPKNYDSLTVSQKYSAPIIYITETSLVSSPSAWVSSIKAPGYSNVRSQTPVSVGGKQGIQYTYNNTQAGENQDQVETAVQLDNKSILLINLNSTANKSDLDTYNQILSTFQFITPTAPPAAVPVSSNSALPLNTNGQ
jgi:hypothetical protein